MINRFMMSVATAALIAGSGIAATGSANAQGTGMSREAPAGGAMQRGGGEASEPKAGGAQSPAGMKPAETEKAPAAAAPRAEESTPSKSKGMNAQTERPADAKGPDAKSAEGKGPDKGGAMKAEGNDGRGGMKQDGRGDEKSAETAKPEGRSQTTGQAGAGAKMSTEQRSKITNVIRDQHVQSVTNVNFSISVGSRIPREVSFHTLPAEVVTIYPEWRGYNYVLVRDQILVIDPGTLEIVAVIDA